MIVGGWISFRCARSHVERFFVASWPTALGRVTASTIESQHRQKGGMTYEVKVVYEYFAEGRTFVGTRIHPTYSADVHYESHQKLLNRLQPSSTVRVYYHPNDLSRSYLASQFISSGLLELIAGLIFLGAGLGFGALMLVVNHGSRDYASFISTP